MKQSDDIAIKDVGGGAVDTVMVGDHTRRMSRGQSDRGTIQADIQSLENRVAQIVEKINRDRASMCGLNAVVKGRHVPQGRYESICAEQAVVKKRILENEIELAAAKKTLFRARDDEYSLGNGSQHKKDRQSELLQLILRELRAIRRDGVRIISEPASPPKDSTD